MAAEVVAALGPRAGGCYADGTLGGGGHAAAILAASAPSGRLYGCDLDSSALAAAGRRLAEFAGRFEIRQGNFAELAEWVPPGSCDGMVLDLGLSSLALDAPERGFSFQEEGSLDMRLDRRQPTTAAELVNRAEPADLARWFWELGGEREARRFARAIAAARQQRPLTTTRQLAELIERLAPRRGRHSHPATRVFLALRLAVNDEIGSLQRGLRGALGLLRPGARLAIVTFHSREDREVREFGREWTRGYTLAEGVDVPELRQPRAPALRWITRKALRPGPAELADNPRSRSAQLRVLEKL
jgi:16S rRNA (cytosine1402-N4)-methyltransferase